MRMMPVAMAALFVTMTTAPAFARPIEIATLGRAPVLGASTNAVELRANMRKNEALMRRAGLAIGLSRSQYDSVRTTIEVGKPNWVVVPRHLDVMTWAYAGRIHTLHDVIIPAGQRGFAVDLPEGDHVLTVYVPAKCGNISLARRAVRHVAAAKIRNFPVPHPATVVAPAVAVAPATVAAPAVVAPAPAIPVAPAVAVTHHGLGLLPLAAALPFLFHGGSGGSVVTPFLGNNTGGGTIVSPPPCPPGTDP
ncbi:MAG: hypothetical protein QOI11_3320 [Candidatus Eremiobacteraeota bacterium]|jgi:hypothetical protein|nr:hypothetical protein [Candidatus Eremiobacteraeota bacterium]